MWQRGRCVLRHASSCCRACSSSWGNDDELLGFINRSSLPSSGRPIDSSRTAYIKLSSLAANSRIAAKARSEPKLRFTSLAHHVTRERVWENLCQIPKDSSPGVDGQSVPEAKESFGEWIEA